MAKYTDEQIKKALELCVNWKSGDCLNCPLADECEKDSEVLIHNSLDLINRQEADLNNIGIALEVTRDNLGDRLVELQQAEVKIDELEAENERLNKQLYHAEVCIDEIEYAYEKVGESNSRVDEALEKYNLVKETVGENNG